MYIFSMNAIVTVPWTTGLGRCASLGSSRPAHLIVRLRLGGVAVTVTYRELITVYRERASSVTLDEVATYSYISFVTDTEGACAHLDT